MGKASISEIPYWWTLCILKIIDGIVIQYPCITQRRIMKMDDLRGMGSSSNV